VLFVATLLAALIVVPAAGGANAATPVSPAPAPDVVQGGGGHMQAGANGGTAAARAATVPGGSAQAKPAATPAATGASAYSVKGVDVASYQQDPNCQTPINWTQVRGAGYTFVLAKATEDIDYVNPCFNGEYNGAKKAGMYAAAYAFAHPDDNNPVQQADYLVQHAQFVNDGKTLPLMLDLESGGSGACWGRTTAGMAGWIRAFVNEVRAKTGKPMIIYTAAGWWNQCLSGYTTSFTDQWLDIASWTTAAGPTLPSNVTTWTFWQYADNGAVPGIKGAVDLDVFKGTTSQLGQLAAPTTAPGKARPAIVSPTTGVVSVFFKGFDGNLWWMTYTPSTGWSTAASLGDGTLGSDPVVTAQSPGNYDVFWTGTDGAVWHTWNSGTTWYHQSFGGSVSGVPAAVTDHNGGVDVLWHGTDGGLWSKHYLPATGWGANTKVTGAGPQICSNPGAVENVAGAVDVFWRGCNGRLYTVRRPSATAAWASIGSDLHGSVAGVPTPTYAAGSVIDVFYRGTDGGLWHSYTHNAASGWSNPYRLGWAPLGSDPAAAGKTTGAEDVLWRGTNGALYHAWFSGGPWTAVKLGGQVQTQPSMVAQASGAVDAVFNDQARSVGHTYYVQGGSWQRPGTLGGFLS
jgi:GH25 family lysozyme M1 (1,4-beta-N-acetylmuramidase)